MIQKPIQHYYPEAGAICFGCGRNNPHGLRIETYWDGSEGVCRYRPRPEYTAFPGAVYGGLIASLIDCHSMATAMAVGTEAAGLTLGHDLLLPFVTGNLNVSFLSPTPVGVEIELRARVKELGPRKIVVTCSVLAEGRECARGEVVAVRVPSNFEV